MTIADRIQRSLIEKIVSGALPPGSRLEEKALADEFGVSRTPIREALRELGSRGLVEFAPRRGSVVAQLGMDQLADMLDAECEMEALCARLASLRMTAVEKSVLQTFHQQTSALVAAKDEMGYWENNQTFHNMICDGAHNSTLTEMTRDLRMRLTPFRRSPRGTGDDELFESHEDHGKIVEAIMNGDPDAAYIAMRWHNARISSGVLGLIKSGAQKRPNSGSRTHVPIAGANPHKTTKKSTARSGRRGSR